MIARDDIRRSLLRKFRKTLYRPFIEAVKTYGLIEEQDAIMCCVSGGKDSILLSLLMQELYDHGTRNFRLGHVMMDPGFTAEYVDHIREIYDHLGLTLTVFTTDIFAVTDRMARENPCFLCARMRRGALYGYAQTHGYNKIALGHHMDDAAETTLMNLFRQGAYRNMLPKLPSQNFPGLSLIRPLYLVREEDIIRFRDYAGLTALSCACVLAKAKERTSRDIIKDMLTEIEQVFPGAKQNIQHAASNVYLDTVLRTR